MEKSMLIGNRVPRSFFVTSGTGESDITIHAGSYHLALKAAGIEMCNIITYSSILPGIAIETKRPDELVHGSVMETIMACGSASKGELATVGIIFGWLYDKKTGEKYGGLVCEYNGHDTEEAAVASLRSSIKELYTNGFDGKYDLKDIRLVSKSFAPKKKFGTAIVALCFTDYIYPVLKCD
jgi:arginine decarboxylase